MQLFNFLALALLSATGFAAEAATENKDAAAAPAAPANTEATADRPGDRYHDGRYRDGRYRDERYRDNRYRDERYRDQRYRDEHRWEREHHEKVSKTNFLQIYAAAHTQTMTPSNIKAAFRKTGTWPVNPAVINSFIVGTQIQLEPFASYHVDLMICSILHTEPAAVVLVGGGRQARQSHSRFGHVHG